MISSAFKSVAFSKACQPFGRPFLVIIKKQIASINQIESLTGQAQSPFQRFEHKLYGSNEISGGLYQNGKTK